MKFGLLIFFCLAVRANILKEINDKVIKPASKLIFGETPENNRTLVLGNGIINNTYRSLQNYSGTVVDISIDGVDRLEVIDQISEIRLAHSLPWIESHYPLDIITIEKLYDVDFLRLYRALEISQKVQIVNSDIQTFPETFVKNISSLSDYSLVLDNSWWSCDCSKKNILSLNLTGLSVMCRVPFKLKGRNFRSLIEDDLSCSYPKDPRAGPVQAIEYQSTSLECAATGYPLPKIIWYSPGGQKIDRDFLSRAAKNDSLKIYAETFSIDEKIVDGIVPSNSHLLSILNVANVNRKTAGQYTCKVANVLTIPSISEKNVSDGLVDFNWSLVDGRARAKNVALSYTPDPATNIAFFIMVGSSFAIAFVINLVNVCRYHCDWKKRIKIIRGNPDRYEIPESVRTSMASIYYQKYDLTCQHAFLDALLKSGHAVKRNLENATQGIEINVSYRDLSERIRENLDNINPSEWRPQFGMPNLGITGSLRGLRDRIGSFEMPGVLNMPKSINIPRSVNINFPSNFSSDWNLRVRISKFSRKWFYGCADNPSNVDEYQIRNENGRVVITPVQEKKDYSDAEKSKIVQNRDNTATPISSITNSEPSEFSSEGLVRGEGSSSEARPLIEADETDSDYVVTIIATPNSKKFIDTCLYESNV